MHDYVCNWCHCLDFCKGANSFPNWCFNNISVNVKMVKSKISLLLNTLDFMVPSKRLLGTPQRSTNHALRIATWNILKLCSTCLVLLINMYIQNPVKIVWRIWGCIWKNLMTVLFILLHNTIIQNHLNFFSVPSLWETISSRCLLMSTSF